jgi:hypothetical protein
MTLGCSPTVLNRLFASLAMVLLLLILPINDAEFDTYDSQDTSAVEQEAALTTSHSTSCQNAVSCNFLFNHAEAAGAFKFATKGASDLPSELTFPEGRADEFDIPPPRRAFL